jgi:TRAP-type transport system small permease protein
MVLVFAAVIMIYGGYRVANSAMGVHTPILHISKALVFSIAPISGVLIVIQQVFNIYEDITMKIEGDK